MAIDDEHLDEHADEHADDHLNDEYEFSDADMIGSEPEGEEPGPQELPKPKEPVNIRRNALIALLSVGLLMLGYKLVGPLFSKRSTQEQTLTPVITPVSVPQPQPKPVVISSTPVPAPQPVQEAPPAADTAQRLSSLESAQRELRSDVDSLSNQLSSIHATMNDITTKLSDLAESVNALSSKVEQQASELTLLTARHRTTTINRPVRRAIPLMVYYLQAVIPGRAWLISKNGTTLTVNEGTRIPGYGVVNVIDSRQGRVLTSSGRIIQFSQQDN